MDGRKDSQVSERQVTEICYAEGTKRENLQIMEKDCLRSSSAFYDI